MVRHADTADEIPGGLTPTGPWHMLPTMEDDMTNVEREAQELEKASNSLMIVRYELLALADAMRGWEESRAFHAALAACYRNEPGAQERKDETFKALMAKCGASVEGA